MGAVAAVVALAMGAAGLRHADQPVVESTADTGRRPARTVEAVGTPVDPVLVDHLFPVDGDAWVVAKVRFGVAAARAKAASVGRCVRQRGYPGAESLLIERAEELGAAVMMALPSLAVISRYWGTRVPPRDSAERLAAFECRRTDRSPASEWEDDATSLRSLEHLGPAIATVEGTTVWADARSCLTAAGAPSDAPEVRRAYRQRVPDVAGDGVSDPPPEFNAYLSWVHDPPSARAFAQCMTPFFAQVERVLQGPRAEFIERHRTTLLELQRRFEAFAGPGG
jgi:hypothetical protein